MWWAFVVDVIIIIIIMLAVLFKTDLKVYFSLKTYTKKKNKKRKVTEKNILKKRKFLIMIDVIDFN